MKRPIFGCLHLTTIAANKEAMDGAVLAVQSELDNMYTFNEKKMSLKDFIDGTKLLCITPKLALARISTLWHLAANHSANMRC